MKSILDGMNSRLDTAEKKVSELEDTVETMQIWNMQEKKTWEKSISELFCCNKTTLSSLTYV